MPKGRNKKYDYHCRMLLSHSLLLLGWLLCYAIHSFTSGDQLRSKLNLGKQTYRLIYNLVAIITFGAVVLYGVIIDTALLFPPTQITFYLGLMLATFGIFIIKRAFRAYSTLKFLGFKKEENTTEELRTEGLQARVRHPLYSGTVLIFLGYALFNPTLASTVTLLALLVYLPFGIRSEEKKLYHIFGKAYEHYKKNTPALIPSFTKKKSQ